MNDAAIERILHRITIQRDGTATAAGDRTWEISFPLDPEDEASPTLSFRCRVTIDGGRVTEIHCDAPVHVRGSAGTSPASPRPPVDQHSPAEAAAVAELQADLAAAFAREAITFASFEELAEYLVTETGADVEDGTVEIAPAEDDDESESVFAAVVTVAREPWISLSTPFADDVDPEWLLEQNGDLTHVHFEGFEGSVSLACAFPLALTTAQRLVELIDDLADFRLRLLDELEGGDEEDEDEG